MIFTTALHSTRPAATERRILEAARQVLARHGLEGFSMREVADKAGITPGAIYKHFSDKQDLIERVVSGSFERLETVLWREIARYPAGSFERIAALGRAYLRFASENLEHFKVLFAPAASGRKKISEMPDRAGYRILRECVADAMRTGEIRRADPDLVSAYLWTRVHGIVTLLMVCDPSEELGVVKGKGKKKEITPERLFELTRGFVLDGLKPRKRSR
jgi:AcrR family transcriptional regulator